jgi:hypothetical protein
MNRMSIDEKICVPIVRDAAVATESMAGGRMIPVECQHFLIPRLFSI